MTPFQKLEAMLPQWCAWCHDCGRWLGLDGAMARANDRSHWLCLDCMIKRPEDKR